MKVRHTYGLHPHLNTWAKYRTYISGQVQRPQVFMMNCFTIKGAKETQCLCASLITANVMSINASKYITRLHSKINDSLKSALTQTGSTELNTLCYMIKKNKPFFSRITDAGASQAYDVMSPHQNKSPALTKKSCRNSCCVLCTV